jgi:NAD-dependent dihydropyrimidine dehydrogenase PreA subunit
MPEMTFVSTLFLGVLGGFYCAGICEGIVVLLNCEAYGSGKLPWTLRVRASRVPWIAAHRSWVTKRIDCIDCIDRGVCVHVCPTGIDIRKGPPYECIGCAACIDTRGEVMDTVGLPRGLVRYSTENAIEGKVAEKDIPARMFRPRIIVYGVIWWRSVRRLWWRLTCGRPSRPISCAIGVRSHVSSRVV